LRAEILQSTLLGGPALFARDQARRLSWQEADEAGPPFLSVRPLTMNSSANSNSCQKLYTALSFARSLGKSRTALHKVLRSVPPTGLLNVAGGNAKAWNLEALPISLRSELEERAKRLHCRDAAHLLETPPKAWQPPVPLNEIAPHSLAKAEKLRRALAPVLARANDPELSAGELEAFGIEQYAIVFGFAVSARYWREIFKRILSRDAGAGQFDRLELYLDERLARKERAPIPTAALRECQDLEQYILDFKNPKNPTSDEQAMLWVRAFEKFEGALLAGKPAAQLKRLLCEFLLAKASFAADTLAAARKQFERKYKQWTGGGRTLAALTDGRTLVGLRRRRPLSEEVRMKIGYYAIKNCGGRVAQAYRELKRAGELPQDLIHNSSSKYYVPRRIRDEWPSGYVNELHIQHIGGSVARNHRPSMIREPSKHSMDAVQGDDLTPPVYTFVPDGRGWFRRIRGQMLPFIDCRSLRVLEFAFVLAESYHSVAIRTAITRLADTFGVPAILYNEGGIWESSKLIKGQAPKNLASSNAEAEGALINLGVRFVHARSPQAKQIEGVIGQLQNRMERHPGYCGRQERKDLPEETRVALRKVDARQMHPGDYFFSHEQWINTLHAICEDYNQEPQDGRYLQGLSPDQAFEKYWNYEDPPIHLDPVCRYRLANEVRSIKVSKGEVRFSVGKVQYEYCSPDILHLSGQNVLVWFDSGYPDLATVTTQDEKHPIVIERKQTVPAFNAPDDLLAREIDRVNAPRLHARAIYRELRANFAPVFRHNMVAPADIRLGQAITEQQEAMREQMDRRTARTSAVQRKARELGLPLHMLNPDIDKVDEGLTMMMEAKRQHDQDMREKEAANE